MNIAVLYKAFEETKNYYKITPSECGNYGSFADMWIEDHNNCLSDRYLGMKRENYIKVATKGISNYKIDGVYKTLIAFNTEEDVKKAISNLLWYLTYRDYGD